MQLISISYLKDVRDEEGERMARDSQATGQGGWIRQKEKDLRAAGLTFFVFYVVKVDFEGSYGNQYFCDGDSERGYQKQERESEHID